MRFLEQIEQQARRQFDEYQAKQQERFNRDPVAHMFDDDSVRFRVNEQAAFLQLVRALWQLPSSHMSGQEELRVRMIGRRPGGKCIFKLVYTGWIIFPSGGSGCNVDSKETTVYLTEEELEELWKQASVRGGASHG